MRKFLLRVFGLILLLSMLVSPAVAHSEESDPRIKGLGEPEALEATLLGGKSRTDSYIVLLEDKSLVSYEGGLVGYPATSPAVTDGELNVSSLASLKYLKYLKGKQDSFITFAASALDRKIDVSLRYDVILNGFAAKMSYEEATRLSSLNGVRAVLPDDVWQLTTDVSPEFLGADQLWMDTDSTPGVLETKGEGMLIGILDTGINMDHPSFAAVGGDGFVHTNPFGTQYKGL